MFTVAVCWQGPNCSVKNIKSVLSVKSSGIILTSEVTVSYISCVSLNGSNTLIMKTNLWNFGEAEEFGSLCPRGSGVRYSVCLSSVLGPRPAEHLRHGSAQAGSSFKFPNFSLQTNSTKCRDERADWGQV